VIAGHLTEEEFWDTRQDLFWQVREEKKLEAGLDSQLLTMRPQETSTGTTGVDEMKFTLTPDRIRSIFIHHPGSKHMIIITD
jgi:hypothetical protein